MGHRMDTENHWEKVYRNKAPNAVSWFRPHLERSLELIKRAALNQSSAIIDIGAGQSTLVDDLLSSGYTDISVLDLSQSAIEVSKARLGSLSDAVTR